MDLVLYKNLSVPNTINKNIVQIGIATGEATTEATDDSNISLRFTGNNNLIAHNESNYFSWNGAFYYITSINYIANGVGVINGEMDLLMTYKAAIMAMTVHAERSSNLGTKDAEDDTRLKSSVSVNSTIAFPNRLDESENGGFYVFTTAQDGYNVGV